MTLRIFRPHRLPLPHLPRSPRHRLRQAQQPSRVSWTFSPPPQLPHRLRLTDRRNQRYRHSRLAHLTRCSRHRHKCVPARPQLVHPRMRRRLRWARRVPPWHHLWAPVPLHCLVNPPSRAEGLTTCGRCPSVLRPRVSPLHQLALERAYGTWRRRRHRQGYGAHRARRDLRRWADLDRS